MIFNKIYNEDCLQTINRMNDGSIDLIITSPPYNLGNNHHTREKRHNPYNDNMPEYEYQSWQTTILNELWFIVSDGGSLLYNHKNRIRDGAQITPYEWLLDTPWVIKQELIWYNGTPNFDKIRFYPATERIYWLAKSSKTKLYNAISHNDVFSQSEWKPEGTSKKHTRAFPEKMVSDLIKCFPNTKTVYDPFMGSGTVGKVCQDLGIDWVGSEISPEYCQLAEERIFGAQ